MTQGADDVRDELRAVARDVLGREPPAWGAPLEAAAGVAQRDPTTAQRWAGLGWFGLEAPEALGGAGATLCEVGVLLEEMGRVLAPETYVASAVLGLGALLSVHPDEGRDRMVRRAVAGDCVLAVAPGDPKHGPSFRLSRDGGAFSLRGEAAFVLGAPSAEELLLVATDGTGDRALAALPATTTGVSVVNQPVLDGTRRFGRLRADVAGLPGERVWPFPVDAVALVQRRGALAVTLDSLGLSAAMLDATVAYAAARHQFGRPIGSFQAVKHACADMLVELSVARELCAVATEDLAVSDPSCAVSLARAKSHACTAAVGIVGKAMQLHGGFGYTWESGIHAFLKRALLNRDLFGSPRAHRKELLRRLAPGGQVREDGGPAPGPLLP